MSSIEVIGGEQLKGELKIQGSKNAALPILAATILNKGISILRNCPKILDVYHMIKILEELGCIVKWEGNSLMVDSSCVTSTTVSEDFVRRMRSSILFLGSLIGKYHEVTIAYPGGCAIGGRPIDLHLSAFEKMNVILEEDENEIIHCYTTEVIGADIFLKLPSVGATQNIILAAVLSKGVTRIFNAAREPEVTELCDYLIKAGAKIAGKGSPFIEVEGVEQLHDVDYTLSADRIVAGTYMTAVAATYGEAIFIDAPFQQLEAVTRTLSKIGCKIDINKEFIKIKCDNKLRSLDLIKTKPYPGFPTDMQSQMMTIFCLAEGRSTIVEEIFSNRYQNANELAKMGAKINVYMNEKKAVITGGRKLHGAVVNAHDLRGGAALVMAGLAAEGKTIIREATYIERGYEDICRDLSILGANIRFCSENAS